MKTISSIRFPNTVADTDKTSYNNKNCEIKEIWKNWEMWPIKWFEVIRDWKTIAEIKESICDIYFE